MLYCRATLHQQTLQAHEGSTQIDASVSAELLRDAVEVHPLLVATETFELDTQTADVFFHGTNPEVSEGEPLATDRGWHFNIDVDTLPLGSIFQFIPEATVEGPMQIVADPGDPYLNIWVNVTLFQQMNIARQQGLTIPSVFCAALVQAIPVIRDLPEDQQVIVPGWADTIRKQADKLGVDLTVNGPDPFEIAQALLGNPFQNLTHFQMLNAEDQPE